MQRFQPYFAIAAAISLCSCTSVADVQNSPVVVAFNSDQAPMKLADCVMPQAVGIAPNLTIRRAESAGTIHIAADLGSESMAAVYDLAIRGADGGSSVEIRTMHDIWGGHPSEVDDLTRIARGCAKF
jgi:hypothetical protein